MSAPVARREDGVLRPVQFLGSKLRTLRPVTDAVTGSLTDGSVVWEPFTGSAVVAQSLAAAGMRVMAADALTSSVTFAGALLGVHRDGCGDVQSLLDSIRELSNREPVPPIWRRWLDLEAEALARGDGRALLDIGTIIPQRWRSLPPGDGPERRKLEEHFAAVNAASDANAYRANGLLSSTYAGTYFGIDQALRLERIRGAVESLAHGGAISRWWCRVALTALCGAASAAVFSAGKHFAQPHRIRDDKDLGFHGKRILQDRGIDVDRTFEAILADVDTASRPSGEGHEARLLRAEDASPEMLRAWHVDAVYADPPYTAQQYSRFYHILETIVTGVAPKLQLIGDKVTRGLYPVGRYMSPYCSKRQAPAAFERLSYISKSAGAKLVISYSASASGATGNARTVRLDDLIELVATAYGRTNVTAYRLEVTYRQFNRADAETPGRMDPEYLIIGDVHAS